MAATDPTVEEYEEPFDAAAWLEEDRAYRRAQDAARERLAEAAESASKAYHAHTLRPFADLP
jgi:hypothetical protein